jgi:hypothetical protein
MPAKKKSTRFADVKHFFRTRTAAIGLIVACILGTGILIAARTSEPTSAAALTEAPATAPLPSEAPKPVVRTTVTAARVAGKPQDAEAAQAAEPVTIEGCLVQDDEAFRLKNTAGEDAPKSRSWKTLGLHKGSKTLDVVDARHRLNLAKHVGEQVSVSGMLLDRELQGSSIKRLAESCN